MNEYQSDSSEASTEKVEEDEIGAAASIVSLRTAVFELAQQRHLTEQRRIRALVLDTPHHSAGRAAAVNRWYRVYCYHRSAARRLDLYISL